MTIEQLNKSGLKGDEYRAAYEIAYAAMKANLVTITGVEHDELVQACQRNAWIKDGGIAFEDDLYFEMDSPFSFVRTNDLKTLREYFAHGNWSIRSGIVYRDLAFINQVNGGDEWWTLKRFDGKWVAFESITFRRVIKSGVFGTLMRNLKRANEYQCVHLEYGSYSA